jgi:hypothetical protein
MSMELCHGGGPDDPNECVHRALSAEQNLGRVAAERDALAAELAATKDELKRERAWHNPTDTARIRDLEAALRWSLRRTLPKDNAEEALFQQYRELANYPSETAVKPDPKCETASWVLLDGIAVCENCRRPIDEIFGHTSDRAGKQ